MITKEAEELSKKSWEYHHMNHELERSDCILVLGSHDTRVAERGAELFMQAWAPLVVMSGGSGRLTKEMWTEAEASLFAKIAMDKGVPADSILIEDRSTTTGENILFTQKLLENNRINAQSFIV